MDRSAGFYGRDDSRPEPRVASTRRLSPGAAPAENTVEGYGVFELAMRPGRAWTLALGLAVAFWTGSLRAQDSGADSPDDAPQSKARARAMPGPGGGQDEKKYRDYNELVRDATRIDGFITLQRKDEHLYAELFPYQFDQPMLVPITIARGLAMAGQPLNGGDEWVVYFHRSGDRVQLVRKNIHYKTGDSDLEKAVKQNFSDSILMSLPIQSVTQMRGQRVLVIDLADVFLGDFAQLGFGFLDRSRTSWHKIKGFPNNVEIEVEATFGGRSAQGNHGDGVIDGRGRTVVIHYSLAKMPDPGYRVRRADDRVGHFLNTVKDFGANDPEGSYVRMVNRWRLEKSDPRAKLSPPKKQIVWYVEDTVPLEYRPAVEEGIREWNKAFEKIGFRDAMAVRWQESGRDDFDPEDINYCTFRWITTNQTYAMSCLRSNPLTGEMIDGDVIFDASWVNHWKRQYAFLTGVPMPTGQAGGDEGVRRTTAVGEIISPMRAAKEGFGLAEILPQTRARLQSAARNPDEAKLELVPSGWDDLQSRLRQRQGAGGFTGCQMSTGMQAEVALAAIALADGEKGEKKDGEPEATKLPDDFLNQLIKEVVMHEVGHSLGLRHNFKASTMLTAEQLHDTSITRVKGLTASVMDYTPVNLAPKGQKQGDFNSTTIGPYDYWAIEYAYKPFDGDEAGELRKIAARSTETDLVFATDEDMFLNNDPLVNTYDIGSDALRFAKDRIALAGELAKDLDAKVIKDGDSYARVRDAFAVLMDQYGNAAHLAASYVGGQSVYRDHKGKNARDPVVPVPAAKQREALSLLVDQVLDDKSFKFPPGLIRRLANAKWYDWGSGGMSGENVEFPVNERVLGIQKLALNACLAPDVLSRLANQELQVDAGADTLRMSEVFRSLTDGVWSELANPTGAKDKAFAVTTLRRNLQREHLRRLSTIVLGQRRNNYEDVFGFVMFFNGGSYPADAKSLARMHLKDVTTRIAKVLDNKDLNVDDTTRAHLEECRHRIAKVVDAGIDSNEP